MGCRNSHQRGYTTVDARVFQATIKLKLIDGVMYKDHEIFGKQDPYCKIFLNQQQFISKVHDEGGKNPVWKQEFNITRSCGDDLFVIQVWNKNVFVDDLIGEGAFSLLQGRDGTGENVKKQMRIYLKGLDAGYVNLDYSVLVAEKSLRHKEVMAKNKKSILKVQPKSLFLIRNIRHLGKMSPMLTIKVGIDAQSTSVAVNKGQYANFTDTLIFNRNEDHDIGIVDCWDYSENSNNQFLGCGFFSLTPSLVAKSRSTADVSLYLENQIIGTAKLIFEQFEDTTNQIYQPNQTLIQNQPSLQQQVVLPLQQVNPVPQQQLTTIQSQLQQQQCIPDQQQIQVQVQGQQQQQIPVNPLNPPNQVSSENQVFKYPNGDEYSGGIINGSREGFGICKYISGFIYEGQWQNNAWNGHGKLSVGGLEYDGMFLNGKKQGKGKLKQANGTIFEGEFVQDKMNGEIIMTKPGGYQSKARYENGILVELLNMIQKPDTLDSDGVLNQGENLISQNQTFALSLQYDGSIQIFDRLQLKPSFQITLDMLKRKIQPPFYMKLMLGDNNTVCLKAFDYINLPYYKTPILTGKPPFRLVMRDDGKYGIYDQQRCLWISH